MELGEGLVAPLHHDAGCAQLIAGLHAHGHEFGLVEGGLDDDHVTLLDGNAALGQEAGVILESCFFHDMISFRVYFHCFEPLFKACKHSMDYTIFLPESQLFCEKFLQKEVFIRILN